MKRRQREKSIVEGRAIIEQGLKKYSQGSTEVAKKEYHKKLEHVLSCFKMNNEKEFLAAVGYGRISIESVMELLFGTLTVQNRGDKRVKGDELALQSIEYHDSSSDILSSPRLTKTGIVVGKERNILLTFCQNCRPLYGEHILGVITKGKGIKVHRQGCKHLLEADEQRVLNVDWDGDSTNVALRSIQVQVLCEDTPGVLANICNAVSSANFSIGSMNLRKVSNGRGLAKFEVMLRTADDLEKGEIAS